MSQSMMKTYPAACKERAGKLAVESEQPIAQTARDLGVNENTRHTGLGTYPRVERQATEPAVLHQRGERLDPRLGPAVPGRERDHAP